MPISWNKTKYIWKEQQQTGLGSLLLIGQLGLGYIQYLMSRMAGSGGHWMPDEDILLQEVRHQPFTLRQRAIWRVFGSLPGEAMRLQEKKSDGMGEWCEYDNLLMHWTITYKHCTWREPMQIHCHKADPSLPATCCSQARAPQWLPDTRMMERMISGGSRHGFRGLWTIDHHIGICWKIGSQSRPTCTLRDKDASGLSGGNQFPQILDVFCIILCKLFISVNLDNQITYTKFSSQGKALPPTTSPISWEKSARKGRADDAKNPEDCLSLQSPQ